MSQKELEKKLMSTEIENGEITLIEFLSEKEPAIANGVRLPKLPEHCRVCIKLYPSADSDIRVELWLPLLNWNGKFLGTGNGGSAGSIVTNSLLTGVSRGFATANTDMGSEADANELIGKPERWVDFGHRATHLMTVVSKQLIMAFYGKEAEYSYFLGCSTGGQQSLMEAQRYPEDYNGIIAFSPAYNRVNLHQSFAWFLQATCSDENSRFLPEQINAVKKRVNDLFVEKSGGASGDEFLSYPGKIEFKAEDTDKIFDGLGLNSAQLNTLKMLYAAPKKPGTNENIFYPQPLGCEISGLQIPYVEKGYYALLGFLQRWAFGKNFDYHKHDYVDDYKKMIELFREELDATNADLSAFKKNGGKLILGTGSTDSLIPYTDGKNYYEKVIEFQKGLINTIDFFRYFHIPGIGHGIGGPGFQEIGISGGLEGLPLDKEHDILSALIEWVENGEAPERLLPIAFIDSDMTKEMSHDRPVFPYPYETEYIGGDPKCRDNFRKKLGSGIY